MGANGVRFGFVFLIAASLLATNSEAFEYFKIFDKFHNRGSVAHNADAPASAVASVSAAATAAGSDSVGGERKKIYNHMAVAQGPEIRRLGKHLTHVRMPTVGKELVIGGFATVLFALVLGYMRATRRKSDVI